MIWTLVLDLVMTIVEHELIAVGKTLDWADIEARATKALSHIFKKPERLIEASLIVTFLIEELKAYVMRSTGWPVADMIADLWGIVFGLRLSAISATTNEMKARAHAALTISQIVVTPKAI